MTVGDVMSYEDAAGRADGCRGDRVRFARAPVIERFTAILSRVAAANRHSLSGPLSRLYWLKIVVVAAFCIGLALGPQLWIGPRSFPAVPLIGGLPAIDGWLAYALFVSLFILAAAILVSPKPQRSIAAFLAVIGVFCMADQTRWQPWVFLYGFLLLTLALYSWDSRDSAGRRSALDIARLMIACTYIFSGLQKTNLNFVDNDFPWIVSPITHLLPSTAGPLHAFAFLVPGVQVAFGIGLLTNRYRRISLFAAVSMHVFILAMFGPLGLDWNYIVWPWTAAMAVLDVLLFADKERYGADDFLSVRKRPYHALVLVVFVLLPALSFFNLWDSFLSAALYSGNLTEGTIYLSDAGQASLPAALATRTTRSSENTHILNLQRWAIEEIAVMPYPEARVYRAVAKYVCGQLGDRRELVLIVREQRMFLSRPETGYRCRDL
jgi:uncharacterized membrane protein YphA (DoxX/SURF4 family)